MTNQNNQNGKTMTMKSFGIVVISAGLLLTLGYAGGKFGTSGAATGVPVQTKRQINFAAVRDDVAKKMRFTQLGNNGIDGLVDALEARGAKVELAENEVGGMSSMRIKVDGIGISPVITGCKSCEPIVFEY